MTRPRLTCAELVELVTDYLEGDLSRAEQSRFEAHLADCVGCERFVEQIQATARVAARLAAAEVDPTEREELIAAFHRWRG